MTPVEEYHRDGFLMSTDPARLDPRAVHAYLSTSYWAEQIPLELVERSIRGSLCFGLYRGAEQIGLTRVITDRATFAYLCDVYVLPEWRGHGLGAWMIECVMGSPSLQGLRRWMLVTRDAHRLYQRVGFAVAAEPGRVMEIVRPGLYRKDP